MINLKDTLTSISGGLTAAGYISYPLPLNSQFATDRFGEFIGLSGIQYSVLVSIAHLQEREKVSVSGVAAHVHFSAAFITTVTN